MMRKRISLILTTHLVLLSHVSHAQNSLWDRVTDHAGDSYWNGVYVGLNMMTGWGTTEQQFTADQLNTTNIITSNLTTNALASVQNNSTSASYNLSNATGPISGLASNFFLGYNYHQPHAHWLLSGQLEGSLFNNISVRSQGTLTGFSSTSNITRNSVDVITNNIQNTSNNSGSVQVDGNELAMFNFLARAGILAKPNLLLYGLAGGSEGKFSFTSPTTTVTTPTSIGQLGSAWELGWLLGGGIEYKLTENWSILGEYRHFDYNFDNRWNTALNTNTGSTATTPNTRTQTTVSNNTAFHLQTYFNFNVGNIGVVYRI